MKLRKILAPLLLAIMVTVSLAGCSGCSGNSGTTPPALKPGDLIECGRNAEYIIQGYAPGVVTTSSDSTLTFNDFTSATPKISSRPWDTFYFTINAKKEITLNKFSFKVQNTTLTTYKFHLLIETEYELRDFYATQSFIYGDTKEIVFDNLNLLFATGYRAEGKYQSGYKGFCLVISELAEDNETELTDIERLELGGTFSIYNFQIG